jgi:uncharacterized protein YidB (DUF937 family)
MGSGGGGMSPLMKALLGMIAFKAIRSLTGSSQSSGAGGGAAASAGGGLGDLLGGLGGLLGGGAAGNTLVGGLSDLLKQFEQSGKGEVAQSWVGSGPNKAISPADLANTLGADKVNALMAYSGMSRDDMLHGLSQQLPELVDQLTPNGRLPTEQEAARLL